MRSLLLLLLLPLLLLLHVCAAGAETRRVRAWSAGARCCCGRGVWGAHLCGKHSGGIGLHHGSVCVLGCWTSAFLRLAGLLAGLAYWLRCVKMGEILGCSEI